MEIQNAYTLKPSHSFSMNSVDILAHVNKGAFTKMLIISLVIIVKTSRFTKMSIMGRMIIYTFMQDFKLMM
jgi:hypothetical protein